MAWHLSGAKASATMMLTCADQLLFTKIYLLSEEIHASFSGQDSMKIEIQCLY